METFEILKIQSRFDDLEKLILELSKSKTIKQEAMESDNTQEISKALSQAQLELETAYNNKVGSFSDYADINACLKVSRTLNKFGLSISQPIMEDETGLTLYTIVRHETGQFLKSKIKIIAPVDGDIRKLCSQINYLRRYCLSSMIGIAGQDEDDDGELAIRSKEDALTKGTSLKEQQRQNINNIGSVVTINQTELDQLNEELEGWPDIAMDIKEQWGLRTLSDMPKANFKFAITKVRKIINARKNEES